MKKKKLFLMLVFALALTMFIPIGANAKAKINKKQVTITVGRKVKLKIKGTKKKVIWKSKNKSIATVNKKGKVTANSTGKTTIIAKAGKKKYKCRVTVKANDTKNTTSKKPTPQAGTRENPIPLSNGYTFTYMDYENNYHTVKLKLLETIDNADSIIYYENTFNEESNGSNRWILYHYKLDYLSGIGEITASDILDTYQLYNDRKTVNIGHLIETASFSEERRGLDVYDVKLYPGGSSDVWIGILVDNSIKYTNLKFLWSDEKSEDHELWFRN